MPSWTTLTLHHKEAKNRVFLKGTVYWQWLWLIDVSFGLKKKPFSSKTNIRLPNTTMGFPHYVWNSTLRKKISKI